MPHTANTTTRHPDEFFGEDMDGREEWRRRLARITDEGLLVGDQQVVQRWEQPVMEAMGKIAASRGGDVLEIGYGLGMSAATIAATGCRSYTVIEAHPEIANAARRWVRSLPCSGNVIEGFWQEVLEDLPLAGFDGILFDTCPIHESERDIWYRAFIPHAYKLLNPGGVFTFFTNQSSSGSFQDWALLTRHFDAVDTPLSIAVTPYPACQYWNESDMLVPVARRLR